jgi:AcrR family transcriptional regulator
MEALPSHNSDDLILDAAIAVLATRGVAGLTQAAVDEELKCTSGTTATHYKTVRKLLEATANRLVLVDSLELASFRASAAGIAAVIERRFTPDGRQRLLARLELVLYAARNPDFVTMHWARDMIAAGAEAHMRIAGARTPRLAAEAVIAVVEGLSLHGFVTARMPRRDRFALIRRVLQGFFAETKARDRL